MLYALLAYGMYYLTEEDVCMLYGLLAYGMDYLTEEDVCMLYGCLLMVPIT